MAIDTSSLGFSSEPRDAVYEDPNAREPGLDVDLIAAARSVDRPGSGAELRFSHREQGHLLGQIPTATRAELERTLRFLSKNATLSAPRFELDRARIWTNPDGTPRQGDKLFREQMLAAVNHALNEPGIPAAPRSFAATRRLAEKSRQPVYEPPRLPAQHAVLLIDAGLSVLPPGLSVKPFVEDKQRRTYEKQRMRDVLRHANATGTPVFEIVTPGFFETDSMFAAERNPKTWVRIEKQDWNAFVADLKGELRARGVTDIVVMGLFQSMCVYETAKSAVDQGFRVQTSPELMQDAQGSGDVEDWFRRYTTYLDDSRQLGLFKKRRSGAKEVQP